MVKSVALVMMVLLSLWPAPPGSLPANAGEIEKSALQQGRYVSDARFREAFLNYLCARLRKPAADVAVSKFNVSDQQAIPAGALTLEVHQKEKGTLLGHVRLAAIVKVNGAAHHEVRMSGWVDVFESVVCTARPIKRGEVIQEEDLFLFRKNIARLRGQTFNGLDSAVGLMARHNLKENTSLLEWMVEKTPILDKGDMVTILAEMGGLRVTVKGVALERGYPGQMVKVQNTMSQKTLFARVIDGSNVMVEF
jgi:flagellar basal body P-ring formation protein FlgA